MKKVLRKLVLRGETLRRLRALDERELARPVGGDITSPGAADETQTKNLMCPAPAVTTG
jgi:hypothetical protein